MLATMNAHLEQAVSSSQFFSDPYPIYDQLRAEAPVFWSEHWGGWFLTRYDDVLRTLREPENFANAGRVIKFLNHLPAHVQEQMPTFYTHYSGGLVHSDLPDHTRLRALVGKAFTPRVVEVMRPKIEAIVESLLDDVQAAGQMDILQAIGYPLPIMVISELFGVPLEDRDRYKQWAYDLFFFFGVSQPDAARAERAEHGLVAMRQYFRALLDERRAKPKTDLLSTLVAAEDRKDTLSEEELLNTCVTMLIAGFETTTNLIGNAMLALLRHSEAMTALREHPENIGSAVEEFLRYDSPIHSNWRLAAQDIAIGGHTIRKGQIVYPMLGAANRDPKQFPDADRLVITRPTNKHLAFGNGIHFCLGAPLARVEAPIAINSILRRMPSIRLGTEALTWHQTIVNHGLRALPVTF